MSQPPVRLYDPRTAAALLSVRESTLREWVRQRKIPHRRLGRAIRFSDADLEAIVAASAVVPMHPPASAPDPPPAVPVPLPKRRRRTHISASS
jgi:excisionase family DNA binding protein